jgi:uncharacterized membrane protein (DUF106 family)
MEETAKAPFWKPALMYGAILGFIGILLSVILYFFDLTLESWVQWVNLVVVLAVMAYCLVAYRKEYLGGYGTFGQIYLMALAIGIISTILGAIFTYILYTVIDPELIDKVKLMAEDRIMNNPRIPENRADDILERMQGRFTPVRMVRSSLVGGVIFSAIIGLILAAFIKKSRPENPVA